MATDLAPTRSDSIRVVVVDDQELFRRGLTMLLNAEDDIEVVGEASDGPGAVSFAAAEVPDVVLMDVRMPKQSGIETCLAAMQATGNAAWAALSTSGLRSLDLPRDIRDVIVLADGDEPGAFGSPARRKAWTSTICSRPAIPHSRRARDEPRSHP